MQAGFFRRKSSSPSVKKLNAIACRNYGIELVFFGPEDVDMENDLIYGEVYENHKWIKKTVSIPKIINNTPSKEKEESLYTYLGDRAHLMFQSFGGKRKEYSRLEKDQTLADVLIPNVRIKNKQHVQAYLTEHGKILFKPLSKKSKQWIFSLEKKDNGYILDDGNQQTTLKLDDFVNIYNELIKGQGLEMSAYISSTTKTGLPFNIRINMEKNEEGKWIRAQNYTNIGFNHTLSSNIKFGGGTVKTKDFLTANFRKEQIKELDQTLKDVARKLPRILEQELAFDINAVGIDLGVNKEGKVYLFEYSTYPDATFAVGQIALLRAGYMHYYLTESIS